MEEHKSAVHPKVCLFFLLINLKKKIYWYWKIACKDCNELIDRYFMEKHLKDECVRRIIQICPYCEMELFIDSPIGFLFFFFCLFC
jgi:hypothetical protein